MRTPLDTLLRHVARPARYAGAELNSRTKHWDSSRVRIALAHPDLYETGTANPRLLSLYAMLAEQESALGERIYAPAQDLVQALKTAGQSLFAVDSHRPLTEFDAVIVDLGRELGWTSILGLLDAAGIALSQAQRSAAHPLVIGWASETTNPEPLADFLDAVLLGDAEAILPDLLDALDSGKASSRSDCLRKLACIQGVYVPSLHAPDDNSRLVGAAPAPVAPRYADPLPPAPTRPPVPWTESLRDRGILEIQRGCPAMSSTHIAGLSAPPVRTRSAQDIHTTLYALIRNTGYEEIDLSGPAMQGIGIAMKDLCALVRGCHEVQTAIHLLPLLPQNVTPDLVKALAGSHRPSLTLAPEVLSSDRLGALMDGPEGVALRAALESGGGDIGVLRLTFVVGHPLEDEAGWKLAGHYIHALHRAAGKRTRLRVSATAFIPHAYTPYVRSSLPDPSVLHGKLQLLRKAVARTGGTLSFPEPEAALVEGIIARGDRRMGAVLRAAWEAGGYLETWRENFSLGRWTTALVSAGLDLETLSRAIPEDAPLPWSHLSPGYSPT